MKKPFLQVAVLNRHVFCFFVICCLLGGSGCLYKESVPTEANLINLLPISRSSLDFFSYDLRSSLLIPYLTDFGELTIGTNIASHFQSISFSIPLPGMVPQAVVLEAVGQSLSSGRSDIRIKLNEQDLGMMIVKPSPRRKVFHLDTVDWNSLINTLRIETDHPDVVVEVINIWLVPGSDFDYTTLEPGNSFTGYAMVRERSGFFETLYLPPDSNVEFPVHLPSSSAFFKTELRTYPQGQSDVTITLTTASAFKTEPPLTISIPIPASQKNWIPLEWNLSERAGRYAILKIENSGNTAIILSGPVLKSQSTQIYTTGLLKIM